MASAAYSLSAFGLSRSFKNRTVVNDVSFEVREGEVVGLLGPNGAGKTTSFYMVVGLLYPDKGDIFLGEQRITDVPMHERARLGVSYLPQNTSIFRKMSVIDNLLSVMEVTQVPKSERKALLEHLLNRFRIEKIAHSMGQSLSGGERRRVEIARALIIKPRFLLLDEPFAGVDPVTVQEIQEIIDNLRLEGLGVLITDHNVRETLGSCQRAYVLSQGKIIAHGKPQEVLKDESVRKNYLGQNFHL